MPLLPLGFELVSLLEKDERSFPSVLLPLEAIGNYRLSGKYQVILACRPRRIAGAILEVDRFPFDPGNNQTFLAYLLGCMVDLENFHTWTKRCRNFHSCYLVLGLDIDLCSPILKIEKQSVKT